METISQLTSINQVQRWKGGMDSDPSSFLHAWHIQMGFQSSLVLGKQTSNLGPRNKNLNDSTNDDKTCFVPHLHRV